MFVDSVCTEDHDEEEERRNEGGSGSGGGGGSVTLSGRPPSTEPALP